MLKMAYCSLQCPVTARFYFKQERQPYLLNLLDIAMP